MLPLLILFYFSDAPPAHAAYGTPLLEKPGIQTGIAAIAWPALIGTVLYWFRRPVEQLVAATVGIAASASKVNIWQIEFDRDV